MLKGYGEELREGRKRKGWTQAELAERLKTSTTSISNYENEESFPTPEMTNELVLALNLSPEVLLQAMGYNLTPPAAAKLPRDLVRALLRMSPRRLESLTWLALGEDPDSGTAGK